LCSSSSSKSVHRGSTPPLPCGRRCVSLILGGPDKLAMALEHPNRDTSPSPPPPSISSASSPPISFLSFFARVQRRRRH
jgi:hypothetical protein